jgi:hypothetical protein
VLGFLFGMAAGLAAGYMYGSERAREEARRRLSAAPEPLRRASQSVVSAAGGSAQRMADAVAAAPVPEAVKQAASRTSSAARSTAEQAGQAVNTSPDLARPTASEIATRPAEPLPRIEPEMPPA